MKPSTYYFHVKTKILADFQICVSVPLPFTSKKFPDTFKLSDITLVYRKVDSSDEANYIPVSIFSLVSKVFENIIYDQLK